MLQNKEKNKIAFCQDFGLKYDKKTALLCLTFPLTEKNNLALIQEVMPGVLEQNVMLALIGIGTQKYQDFFEKLAKENPKRIAIVANSDENKRKVYAASDIFLNTCASEECLEEMDHAIQYGVIPVSEQCELVADYNGSKETGNAFVYNETSPWSFFASLVRALENFKFPYDWKILMANAMGKEDEQEAVEEDE